MATLLVALGWAAPVKADWVEFTDATTTRLVSAPQLGVSDVEERSFAWGDVDHDGDIDLVVARKQPFSTPGKRPNVLFLNERGVLVDRTADFAAASDVPGDQGFLTPTCDRNITLADVDLDGWLDVVTATAHGGSDPKAIAYPRIYRNRGESGGMWRGFRHEDARIPAMLSYDGNAGFNPNFAFVAVGDLTGDGYPELYFSEYDAGSEPAGSDFNDKLLLNQGAANPGFFTDVTATAFTGAVPVPGSPDPPFPVSGFGTSAAIVDFNGDEATDIVKLTTEFNPFYLGVAYGDTVSPGTFDTYDVISTASPYYFSTGDLNNDDRLDLVITDDGADRHMRNLGNGGDGLANFAAATFSFLHDGAGTPAGDAGFGGDSVIADLDNDGWNDVLITDVNIDIPGCGRRLNVYRNLGGSSGGPVVLQEQTSGTQCANFFGNPPTCVVAGVPASLLEGAHDVAVFDIDGDGWTDVVLARCTGTTVLMNVPHVPAGSVSDDESGRSPLLVARDELGRVLLDWEASCLTTDSDYAVYRGTLGDFTSHVPHACSTNGVTDFTLVATGDSYFLVVPHNGDREGSYGRDSEGNERPASAAACFEQLLGACE